jgi:hypothetical protein
MLRSRATQSGDRGSKKKKEREREGEKCCMQRGIAWSPKTEKDGNNWLADTGE